MSNDLRLSEAARALPEVEVNLIPDAVTAVLHREPGEREKQRERSLWHRVRAHPNVLGRSGHRIRASLGECA